MLCIYLFNDYLLSASETSHCSDGRPHFCDVHTVINWWNISQVLCGTFGFSGADIARMPDQLWNIVT